MSSDSKDITDEWLESLAFFRDKSYPLGVLLIHTNGYTLESWRRYTDERNERRWFLNSKEVYPPPRNRKEVKQLLQRLRT